MASETAGDAPWWDSQAQDFTQARFAVWSMPDDTWQSSTDTCVETVCAHLPPDPTTLLDVGCAFGRLTVPIAARYPKAKVCGFDVSERMLDLAKDYAKDQGSTGITWTSGNGRDVPQTPLSGAWSVVVFQHNTPDVCADLVASVGKVLEPGGKFIFQTITDVEISDWGHLPESVPLGWCTDAGLEVETVFNGVIYHDWRWVVAVKP